MGIDVDYEQLEAIDPDLIVTTPHNTPFDGVKVVGVIVDFTSYYHKFRFMRPDRPASFIAAVLRMIRDSLLIHNAPLIFTWDKAHCTPLRAVMKESRYPVPDPGDKIPAGKMRSPVDGRDYKHEERPYAPDDPLGKITAEYMPSLARLFSSSQGKNELSAFICQGVYDELSRQENGAYIYPHTIIDTPVHPGFPICDGNVHCTRANCDCNQLDIPRHGESDILTLYYARMMYQEFVKNPTDVVLISGATDRDSLVVLSSPFDSTMAKHIIWHKATSKYAITPAGVYIKQPTEKMKKEHPERYIVTGAYESRDEYIQVRRIVDIFSRGDPLMHPSRAMALFMMKSDLCDCPEGFQKPALLKSIMSASIPWLTCRVVHSEDAGAEYGFAQPNVQGPLIPYNCLILRLFPLARMLADARQNVRLKQKSACNDLLLRIIQAFYSIAYYTACHPLRTERTYTGPDIACFGLRIEKIVPVVKKAPTDELELPDLVPPKTQKPPRARLTVTLDPAVTARYDGILKEAVQPDYFPRGDEPILFYKWHI